MLRHPHDPSCSVPRSSLNSEALKTLQSRVGLSRDKRGITHGLYVVEALYAAGLRVTFHPADALHITLPQAQFESVRGKAGREPLLLMALEAAAKPPRLDIKVCGRACHSFRFTLCT